jgi:hypothetical protein
VLLLWRPILIWRRAPVLVPISLLQLLLHIIGGIWVKNAWLHKSGIEVEGVCEQRVYMRRNEWHLWHALHCQVVRHVMHWRRFDGMHAWLGIRLGIRPALF